MPDNSRIPVIVAAARTPIGKFLGSLASVSAPELGAVAIRAAVQRSGIDVGEIEEVIMGNVLQGGVGQAPARQAALKAGVPANVSAMTVNKVCASGLKAVMLAAQAIKAGDADVVVAGGQENMSASPHVLLNSREGNRMGEWKMVDSMIVDGLWDVYNQYHMGVTAENVAREQVVTREEQDEFAVKSQNKTEAAQKAGRFKDEIVPYEVPSRKGPVVFADDEYPRHGATIEAMKGLKPAFDKNGTVTAANASGINDGAAAVILASAEAAKRHGLTPRARVLSMASAAVPPRVMGIGPVPSTRKLMARLGFKIGDFDLIEINEAFASQGLACLRQLGVADDAEHVNPHGGAIALGHPLGCSGARITTTLLHLMKAKGATTGVATMCIGFGQGVATVFERV